MDQKPIASEEKKTYSFAYFIAYFTFFWNNSTRQTNSKHNF